MNEIEFQKVITNLCRRIERMCRYSLLEKEEVNKESMKDRNIVLGLYKFYINRGEDKSVSEEKARVSAIRLILNEAFS